MVTELERLALTCWMIVDFMNDLHPIRLAALTAASWIVPGYSVELGYKLGGKLVMYRSIYWKELLLDPNPTKVRVIASAVDTELVDFYRYN